MNSKLVLALLCVCAPCWAQTAPAATTTPSTAAAPAPTERGEPNVRHSVIEDRGSKIDQLTVRGQVQHVVVTPKVGLTKPYEIVTAPTGQDPFDGTGGARTAAGKRVWNVLNF
jgi:hypothetical protein